MPDYKEMYLTMVRETEKAITILEEVEEASNILIAAQRDCEEMYINSPEPVVQLLDRRDRPAEREAGNKANHTPYTEAEKRRIDNILKAFANFIREQNYFDIVYSEKVGYVQLLTGRAETEPATILKTAEELVDTLFYEVTNKVVYDPNNQRPNRDTLELSEYEESESRRLLTEIVDTMEEDRDCWTAYLDAYFKDYQGSFK